MGILLFQVSLFTRSPCEYVLPIWASFTLVTQHVVQVPKSFKMTLEEVGQVLYCKENDLIKLLSAVIFILFFFSHERLQCHLTLGIACFFVIS